MSPLRVPGSSIIPPATCRIAALTTPSTAHTAFWGLTTTTRPPAPAIPFPAIAPALFAHDRSCLFSMDPIGCMLFPRAGIKTQ
nr:hypothetical protein [Candidatus Sigynarchaeum springense]